MLVQCSALLLVYSAPPNSSGSTLRGNCTRLDKPMVQPQSKTGATSMVHLCNKLVQAMVVSKLEIKTTAMKMVPAQQ